ncbi:MAG TPA: FHA domain-containing protein [Planctomycetota bacterium]|nr:FHA domain-containing protein [Planctomycetota bacterium]
MARLVIFDETVRGVDLPSRPVILGRSKKTDIPIHDEVLSRKHCTIVPATEEGASSRAAAPGLRLIDLNSSNGTYLNGSRIKRSALKFDDIIEIGNTVIVLLDTDTWNRGDGLTRLRNPLKAQELIQAIKKRSGLAKSKNGAPAPGESASKPRRPAGARSRQKGKAAAAPGPPDVLSDFLSGPLAAELMEAYVLHQIVALGAKRSRKLRKMLRSVLERILLERPLPGGPLGGGMDQLRAAVRSAVAEVLGQHPGGEAGAAKPEAELPPAEGTPGPDWKS